MRSHEESIRLQKIFDRTNGRCHLCRGPLQFDRFGVVGQPGAWEREHSVARANGGTDHLNNLYAACIPCNRSKQDRSTATVRRTNGYRSAPLSAEQKSGNAVIGGSLGVLAGLLVPPHIRLAVAVFGGVVGALIAHSHDPE